jgi:hypothetical protein
MQPTQLWETPATWQVQPLPPLLQALLLELDLCLVWSLLQTESSMPCQGL